MKHGITAAIVGVLAAGSVILGVLDSGDTPTGKPSAKAEMKMYVLPTCPDADSADTVQCPGGVMQSDSGRCLCFAPADVAPTGAIDPASAPREQKKKLLQCTVGAKTLTRWVPATAAVPPQCVDLTGDVLEPVTGSMGAGVETEFDAAMRARCAPYPVYPGDHGHCPECVAWPGGCPPCREIATRYGRDWQGHEGECPE
jgi:hypothetical protein